MKKVLLIGFLILAVFLLLRQLGSGPNVSQNGISPMQFADNLMAKYDANADGKLDVTDESFLRTQINDVVKVESRGLLFTDADAFGNSDNVVSTAELVNYLAEFDTDGDGEITSFQNVFESIVGGSSEWATFDEKYEERLKYNEP